MKWFKRKQLKPNGRRTAVYEYTPNGRFVRRYDSVKECNKRNFPECNPSNSLFRNRSWFGRYGVLRNGNYVFKNEVETEIISNIRNSNSYDANPEELTDVRFIDAIYNNVMVATFRNEHGASHFTGIPADVILKAAKNYDTVKGWDFEFNNFKG